MTNCDDIQVQRTPQTKGRGTALTPEPEEDEAGCNFKERYFIMVDHKLIMFHSEDDQQERGILHLKYSRLKLTSLKDPNTKLYGFFLMAKGTRMAFYARD